MLGFSRRDLFYNFLIWSVVAVFTATQLYLRAQQGDGGGGESWWLFMRGQLLVWWVWGIITPLVFWLGRRFRLDKASLWRNLVIHLPVSIVIVLSYLGIYTLIWSFNAWGGITLVDFKPLFIALFLNLFHWHLFIYMAIIGIVHARVFYLESRDQALRAVQLEKELLVSQLSFLKMQLQPHFLFNTLNGIVSSIRQEKTDTAVQMTTGLSDLLRISLAGSDRQIVTLAQEMEHLKAYLQIEKYRFKDLRVELNVPEELAQEELPSFLLQPLVENAIKHGISKQTDARLLAISAQPSQDSLKIEIFNEGPAINKSQEEGVGLSNVRKRLKSLYGDLASLDLRAASNGVLATVYLPLS